ncbi:DNA-dependent protein kinase catalytic subunit-like [Watersipora subatra]|uniref:DNA-dependent protein kinase catalytic subunit-like n=1 Tax=Watersipora subatra TaxID=2589382 RepID=UPI00355B5D20
MPRKSKRLVSARELKEEGQEEGDTVVYMQSVADSSLTEDLAKYDFSYSQSFASSRQRQEEKEQEQLELLYPDKETIEASSAVISQGYVEYESDRLNEHECMASFISLLQHMYRNGITPSHADEGDELPGWMQWLKDKMDTATVPYNVKHFIARLILNTEKVFSPFAQHWLPSLVKYITSCCQELHYFAIDVIVMVIMWEETRPQRQQEEKAMLRSLTQHIMNHVHHDRKGVFKNNLDLLKNCLERWKSFMTVDTSTIASFLQSSEDKKVLTGVQLVGVVIANKIEPYNADRAGNIGKQAFYCLLAKSLMNRLLSVYSSTAEVLGLTFKYLSLLSDSNSHSFLTEYEKFVEKGLSSAKVPVHKLIVCLYGITRHYAPFSGRFLPKVLFEVKRLHGDLRQKAVEIIASGIAETDSPYEKLSAIDFPDLLMHRNAHIMESCLRVFRNILPKLTAEQTLSWLPKAVKCQAMGNAACRSLSHSIFMNIYSTYRNESPTDTVNQLVVSSQEQLLLALSDDLLDNRLVVQNYWSADNTISQQVLPRLCGVLKHMYSTHTESSFLSYATNLLLELTSRSTDFERPVFRNALSECNFTTYAINSTWSQRYSTLAPMFADGTMSQSASSLDVGLLRGTQATQQFTATQAVTGQKLFNWMTQSSLDASLSSSSSMTESSLLFTVGPKASSPAKSSLPNKIAVGQPKRSKDAVNKESNPELAALRRRFIKDQESSRIYFAKREARRKRMEEERRQASKNQRENQVTIYRQYRAGDLPDIQIKYSAVIAPLQALAQKDSAIARMLFLVVYKAILTHPDAERSMVGDVLALVGGILRTSSECHPPLIASLLDLLIDLSELDETSFDSAVVCDSSVQCKQQPSGVVALECRLACEETKTDGPKAKRRKTSTASTSTPFNEANALTWTDLARLHKSLGNYDMVHSIMSEKVNVHELTRQALEKESRHDYEAAADLYESVLQNEKLEELVELSLIDDGRLHCLEQLSSWEEMGETLLANLGGDVSSLWADTSKDYYLKAYMKCQTRRLMDWKSGRLSFLDFIDESCKVAEQRSILEINHSEELSLIFMAQKDFERAKQYHQLSCERFLLEWSSLSQLMVNARADSVQTLQRLTEMGEFLSFITALDTDASNVGAVRAKVDEWLARSPGDLYSTSCWDSIMANRIFFTHMLDNQLPTDQFIEDRLDMNLNLAAHAATSGNIGLASSLLRSTLKDKREFGACLRVQLKWSAAGVLIKQRMANAADASLSLRVEHSSAAVLNMDRFKDVEIDAAVKPNETLYYQWYSLKGRTWSCLLSSILESTDEERASCSQALEQLVNRSGTEQVVCKVSHLAQESIQKSIRSHVPSLVSKAHLDMVVFADSLLRHSEEASDRLVVELSGIKECLVTSCAKALTLGSAEASTWVPRLLQLIELYPDIVPLFVEKTKEVPSWMFISWVSQMVVLLDREQAFAVQHIVMDIAQLYPMAVIYPFKISCVSYTFNTAGAAEGQSRLFLSKLSEVLTKSCRHVDTFIRALEQLSQPEALFSDWLAEWKEMTGRPRVDTQLIEEKYREMYEAILSQGETSGDESLYEQEPTFANVNNYRKQFSKAFSDKVLKVAGTRGEKLCNGSMKAVQDSLCKIAGDMKKKCAKDKELSPPTLLKDYSSWLASFSAELLDYDMEIPGQYGRKTLHKPIPENHVKIAGFDEKVLVLESLRKPKRIIIRGNDAKDYKFLVKGGEDLRLDQRIQTISTNINSMLSNESSCRSLSLTTYRVIPMNTRLGLIEWMDNVVTLKDLLKDTRTNAETQTYEMIYKDYRRKNCSDSGSYIFIDNYAKLRSRDCQDWMLALLHKSPHHLLSRALKSMSRSVESYYMLREHCITSHAVLCVCHYLLGIGDRHLSNFMMDTTSGGIVGIDFGHAFGSATSLLPIPELVPFRLTKLFTDLMSPYGTHGLFGSTMVNVLRLLRDNRRQLLNLLDVFIKEPSLDWMHNAKKQTTKASFEDTLDGIERVGPSQEEDVDWYPKEKVKFAKLKLLGAHPRCITAEEVKLNPAIKKHQKMAVSHVMPDSSVNMDTRLLVEAQVRALIDQASDPNLLGRIWFGFEPLV